ncbi:MAG: hypothetical protein R3B13_26665 [Polyangiaceae bacterium]
MVRREWGGVRAGWGAPRQVATICRWAFVAAMPMLVACGSSDDPAPPSSSRPTLDFKFSASVQAGDEIQKCQFVQLPKDGDELVVGRIFHKYSPGSHHFLVYRTELTEIPSGGEQLITCDETDWMSNVRGVIYAAQETDGEFVMPQGVGQKFEPGEVMLVQTHYLNTTPSTLDAQIDLHMELMEPKELEHEAGVLFFYNPAISLGAAASGSAELTCPLPAEVTLGFAASHMHKRGTFFTADSTDKAAAALLGPLYETTEWEEPVPRVFALDPAARLAAGSQIRYRCDFDNAGAAPVVSGPSADTNEMCMFVAMYWPRQDQHTEFCRGGKTTSSGTVGSVDTFKCLVGCGGSGPNPSCSSSCWANACPGAPMPLVDFAFCLQEDCGLECALDPTGASCKSCVGKTCPDAYERFVNASCN